jgi:hypothetical protein
MFNELTEDCGNKGVKLCLSTEDLMHYLVNENSSFKKNLSNVLSFKGNL